MRRHPDPAGRSTKPELPADDVPSPEVLDELLRAFSLETDDATLAGVDLASPEVAELLAPTGSTPPPADPQPDVEVEVEGSEPHPAVEDDAAAADAEDPANPPVPTGAAADIAPTADAPASPPAEREPEPTSVADANAAPPAAPLGLGAVPGEPAGPAAAPEPAHEVPSSATTRTIVIDASDDPPDAVYLAAGDPLLAASAGGRGLAAAKAVDPGATSSGAPVFIDDAAVEAGETISLADASSATRIEPRMRERRIAVKRAAGRKRLRWALLVGVVLVLVIGALATLGSSLFAIDDVTVDGAVRTDAARLQAVVDELQGTPVLRADTDKAERDLEAIPWVADARVTTQFPHGATVEIRERSPVATYQGADGRVRVIDVDGRILEVLDAQPADLLPITSADLRDLEPGQFAAQGFIAAANLVQALTPQVRAVAASVAVTGNGSDLRLTLTDGQEVRFGPGRDLVVKLVRLQTKLAELGDSGFQYIDVSTDDVTTG